MSKMDWKDKQLEDLLREMPKINDNQNPEDLYQAISLKLNKKKRVGKFIPALASAAAIILFISLIPNLFQYEDQVKQDSFQETKREDMNTEEQANNKLVDENSSQEQFDTMMQTEPTRISVYKEELNGKELLTYGIPDRHGLNVVPISILVDKDDSNRWFEQFVDNMPKLTEEAWGLSEYYPLNGNLSFDSVEKKVHINLLPNHSYGKDLTAELIFQNAIITSFRQRDDVNTITFSTDNKPGIVVGNNTIDQINVNEKRVVRKPYLLLYVENRSQPMLVQVQEIVATFDDALTLMKDDEPKLGLTASIPNELVIEKVSIMKEHVTVELGNPTEIPQTEIINFAVEAILLSAKEFGYTTVEFKHDKTSTIGQFPTNQPIEVPIAPNNFVLN
ncbi:MAG: hypothetical protein AB2401_07635 [Bacillus sp. (in: firmicutes)]